LADSLSGLEELLGGESLLLEQGQDVAGENRSQRLEEIVDEGVAAFVIGMPAPKPGPSPMARITSRTSVARMAWQQTSNALIGLAAEREGLVIGDAREQTYENRRLRAIPNSRLGVDGDVTGFDPLEATSAIDRPPCETGRLVRARSCGLL
jgi:hypothetical protein